MNISSIYTSLEQADTFIALAWLVMFFITALLGYMLFILTQDGGD